VDVVRGRGVTGQAEVGRRILKTSLLLLPRFSIPETISPSPVIPPDRDLTVWGRLKHFVSEWEKITSDKWVLDTVGEGLKLKFKSLPPLSKTPKPVSLPKDNLKKEELLA
jgi:hypothetical protein